MKVTVTAAALTAAASIALAAPAAAAPEEDALFLYTLNKAGVTYDSADRALASAHAVYNDLEAGLTLDEVALDVWLSTPLLPDGAAAFTAAAVAAYCPWRIPAHAKGVGAA